MISDLLLNNTTSYIWCEYTRRNVVKCFKQTSFYLKIVPQVNAVYGLRSSNIKKKKTYFTKNIFKKYKLLFNEKQFMISININTIIEIPDHVRITYRAV